MSESDDLLALHLVPGLGPRLTAALLRRFGSARAILQAKTDELQSVPHIGPKLAAELTAAFATVNVDTELERIRQHDAHVLTQDQSNYPEPLRHLDDMPPLLYLRGQWEERDANSVAIVGSRQCTSYGKRVAERLAGDLVLAGYTVISGLARGIDGVAHRAALAAGGRTIAVLAGGLSKIYPPEHQELAQAVAAHGALITEATMAQQPLPDMFPARNRLISGLCKGVVIVEAAEKSGALITARHAGEQGKEVFAVPGPIDSPASAGCLKLIREGAKLVRGVDDILEELGGSIVKPGGPADPPIPPPGMDGTQLRIWEHLAAEAKHLDEMARQLGIAVPQLSGALMMLEMKKAVRRLPGNRYERT